MNRLTEPLLAHIAALREGPLSAAAQLAARIAIRDSLGVAIAGAAIAHSRTLQRLWGAGPEGEARIWGTAARATRDQAAMLNAFAIHNQEFDCVHEPAVVHPMAVVLATLLTEADVRGGVSGEKLERAVILGVEVAALIGLCSRAPMRFFRPAMCGALGATAGLAHLRDHDAATLHQALGLVYSQLSGTMQAHLEGLPTLALQIAWNARAALTAADLAGAGLSGPRDFLEGPFGYFALVDGRHDTARTLTVMAGKRRCIEQISLKPFPSGRASHGALGVLTGLLEDGEINATDVDAVHLRAPPLIRRLIGRPLKAGMDPSYARLCLPYLVSTCLARGTVGLPDFTTAAMNDASRGAFAGRVVVEPNDVQDDNALAPQTVLVRLHDGRRIERSLHTLLGSPSSPMSAERQQAKFAHCLDHAGFVIGSAQRMRLDRALDDLASLSDVRSLVDLTQPAAEPDD